MSKNGKRYFLDYLATIIAIISLLISMKGCQISNDAKKIAEESLDTAKDQFVQINRPYITITCKKFDNGQFWKITQNKNEVMITLKYEIKNVGNVAAKNINLPNKIVVGKLKKETPVYYQKPGKITLGPGSSLNITPTNKMGYESEEIAKENYEYFLSDKSEGTALFLSVTYESEVDKMHKYRTFVENKIHNDKALLIKSEMLTLTTDE